MVVLLLRLARNRLGVRRPNRRSFDPDRDLVVKDLLLRVGILGEDQQGLGIERRQRMRIGALGGRGDPALILAEEIPDGVQQGRAGPS